MGLGEADVCEVRCLPVLPDIDNSGYVDSIIEIPQAPQHPGSFHFTQKLCCGGLAGVVSRTLTAPCDRLKVLLQVQGQQQVVKGAGQMKSIQIVRAMWKEGFLTMWRGNGVNCFKIFPENALRFLIFENLCDWEVFKFQFTGDYLNNKFCYGAATGMVVQTFMYPIELMKTRVMTAPAGEPQGLRAALQKIRSEGKYTKILYRGFGPAICGVIPFAALELGLSKTGTEKLKRYYGRNYLDFWSLLAVSSTSSLVAMGTTYPFRLLTCRMQAYTGRETHRPSAGCLFKQIGKQEGVKGFYRGFSANCIKAVPSSAIAWTVYSKSTEYWQRYNS